MALEQKHRLADVYGIGRDLPLNYVTRTKVDQAFLDNLTRDKHLIIYGSSKQGKTSLRKNCLNDSDYIVIHCNNRWDLSDLHSAILKRAGYDVTQSTSKTTAGKNKVHATLGIGLRIAGENERSRSETVIQTPLELDVEDVNDIIRALSDFNKYIVLEDFHYLPIETQQGFSFALKAFHEQSSLCFIIVGVWLEENRLTVYNGDLTGRVVSINADTWTSEELTEVIEVGGKLLNIEFHSNFKVDLIKKCLGSVYIVQECCYKACEAAGVSETREALTEIGASLDLSAIVQEVVNQQTGRYLGFINSFAAGFQETALQMYRWLLYPILTASIEQLEAGLKYRVLRDKLRQYHPEKNSLNPGNLTQALQSTASLQIKKSIQPIILDYDQTNLVLNVVDRSFLIWLSTQDRKELLQLAQLPDEIGSPDPQQLSLPEAV